MKKTILLITFIAATAVMNNTNAQFRFNVNVRLGLPAWLSGGNAESDFYYMPEIDAYYNVRERQFVYLDNGRWIFASNLPGRFSGFDLYNCRKFPIYESRPYLNGDYYRNQYAQYRNNYIYHQPTVAYNYQRSNERHGYDRDDYYRNDRRFEERHEERRSYDRRYEDHDRDHRERH